MRFFRNLIFGEIFISDNAEYDNWQTELKKYVVLSDFHEQFEVINYIGKGASARVFSSLRKGTTDKYAIKAFAKADSNELKKMVWLLFHF